VDAAIGRGGMAEVYKVWDKQRATHLALKLLHEDLAQDRVFLRRFQREARTLATLQHPNIVRYYGLERDGLLAFMLMDYVEGTSLRTEIYQLAGRPMAAARIIEILRPVLSALHYAHQQGMVHCDIKPGNIMIEKSGKVLVADFGIARMTDAATATMVGMGTPAYMAPELVRGQEPLPQTDIYSLGVILFEMLTGGERPFTGELAEITGSTSEKVRWEQTHLEPPPPRRWNQEISSDVEDVVQRCLAKDPKARYQGAQNLFQALSSTLVVRESMHSPALQPEPLPLRERMDPTSAKKHARARKWSRTAGVRSISWLRGRMWMWALGAAIFISVLAGAVLMLRSQGGEPIPAVTASTAESALPATLPPTRFASESPAPTLTPPSSSTATMMPSPTPTLAAGSTRTSPIDEMVLVFVPVADMPWFTGEGGYWIDSTEVTNAMYALCVEAGACTPPASVSSRTRSHYYDNPAFADYPVIHVNWYQAQAYCAWVDRQLPSRDEWNFAKTVTWRGSCTTANLYPCSEDTMPVGSFPLGASIYGALDMAGNVAEWVSSVSDGTNYWEDPNSSEPRNYLGGSWSSIPSVAFQSRVRRPDSTTDYVGFRCALHAP
jgi:serine/threonine protein kinase